MNIFQDVPHFLDRIFLSLAKDDIDVSGFLLDHLCYRVETLEEYSVMRQYFESYGKILKEEKMIGGRPIATYKLNAPIVYRNRLIPCIEIPAPKEGSPYPTGWEHAEFVIDTSLVEFMSKYPNVKWKTDGIHRPINPEIAISYGKFSIKFHNHPLEYVIMELE